MIKNKHSRKSNTFQKYLYCCKPMADILKNIKIISLSLLVRVWGGGKRLCVLLFLYISAPLSNSFFRNLHLCLHLFLLKTVYLQARAWLSDFVIFCSRVHLYEASHDVRQIKRFLNPKCSLTATISSKSCLRV